MTRKLSKLAHTLQTRRVKRNMSPREVAERVGVSVVSIYNWESDYVRPRPENLTALCKVLGLPVRVTRELADQ